MLRAARVSPARGTWCTQKTKSAFRDPATTHALLPAAISGLFSAIGRALLMRECVRRLQLPTAWGLLRVLGHPP